MLILGGNTSVIEAGHENDVMAAHTPPKRQIRLYLRTSKKIGIRSAIGKINVTREKKEIHKLRKRTI
uniref:Uncharacterized protein n=1 Tax=Romanomermis culicivorax TaxID=13658 RepID=A0A915I5G1_ROMCU